MIDMKLTDFVKEENFGAYESLPDGDTYIILLDTTVEAIEVEFEGKNKTRYKLKTGDHEYIVGTQVMKGIQEAITKKPDCKKVRITKTGEKMNTKYTVIAVTE
jgi:predicted nucleic acid-binding protein